MRVSLLAVLLLACGNEAREDCTVRESAGEVTLRCPSGPSRTWPSDGVACEVAGDALVCDDGTMVPLEPEELAACDVVTLEDRVEIRCEDGSTFTVSPLQPGAVTGVILLGGELEHGGTRVEVGGLGTVTAADGSFVLEGVPPGLHTLSASHPGFQPLTLEDVAVLPGVRELPVHLLAR